MPQFKKNSIGCACCGCLGCPVPAVTLSGFASDAGSECTNCSVFNGTYLLTPNTGFVGEDQFFCDLDRQGQLTCYWRENFEVLSSGCPTLAGLRISVLLQRNLDDTWNLACEWIPSGGFFNPIVRFSRMNIVATQCLDIDETFVIGDRCQPADIADVAPCDPAENANIITRVQFPI